MRSISRCSAGVCWMRRASSGCGPAGYFTSNSSIFNETDFEQLKEMNPRSAADEKKYQKYLAGQQFVADVLTILEADRSDLVFMDYSEFEKHLKSLAGQG